MSTIRAIVVDPNAPARLTIDSVEAPNPAASDALVRVHALSLNRGETRGAQTAAAGARPGWDIAGIVEQQAADGTGPKTGQRVVGMLRTGAWAELVAIPSSALAVVPESVSFAQASTLPVAGLTALYALDRSPGILGRNVLVTGASGGVGHLAVQMAAYGGAAVTGLVRQERHVASVREAGATNVYADETGAAAKDSGPYHLILESIGGQMLGNVLGMVAPFGMVVSYGTSGGGPLTIDSAAVLRSRLTMSGLSVFTEQHKETAGVGLARLLTMVDSGALKPLISIEAPWTDIGKVAQQLLDREYPGKAVLTVG